MTREAGISHERAKNIESLPLGRFDNGRDVIKGLRAVEHPKAANDFAVNDTITQGSFRSVVFKRNLRIAQEVE